MTHQPHPNDEAAAKALGQLPGVPTSGPGYSWNKPRTTSVPIDTTKVNGSNQPPIPPQSQTEKPFETVSDTSVPSSSGDDEFTRTVRGTIVQAVESWFNGLQHNNEDYVLTALEKSVEHIVKLHEADKAQAVREAVAGELSDQSKGFHHIYDKLPAATKFVFQPIMTAIDRRLAYLQAPQPTSTGEEQ